MKLPVIMSAALLLAAFNAAAEEFAELRQELSARMPELAIGEIRKLPFGDLYEIQANGNNVFYTDGKGEIGLFGNLVDLRSRNNLTEARKQELMVVDFAQLPLDKAIVKVKGTGARKLAVFSDPDCPYCKQLERELESLSDATIYTFLLPLAQLHPDAPRKARLVWCAPDRSAAWDELMLRGREPPPAAADCEAPIGLVAELAARFYITGTPGMVFENNRLVPGVLPRDQIEAILADHKS